jgi:hypothetical protein
MLPANSNIKLSKSAMLEELKKMAQKTDTHIVLL